MSNSQQKKKKRSNTSKRHNKQEPGGPRLFSAFGKFSNDLLLNGYVYDQTLSISTHNSNGVTITSRATGHGTRWTANIGTKYKYKNAGIEVNFDRKSSISTTLTYRGKLLPSTNINASLRFPEYGSSKISTTYGGKLSPSININASLRFPEYGSSKLNLKFQQSFRNVALSISVSLNQSPDISLSTTFGTSSIAFGIESRYSTASCSFTRYDAGISFTNRSRDASIILTERGDLLRLAYAHHFGQPRKMSAVAEVTRRLSKNENSLAVGVLCIVDNLTTAKAKLNSRGKLQALLQHKIRPKSSLNISGEIDVKALDKNPRIGLVLALML